MNKVEPKRIISPKRPKLVFSYIIKSQFDCRPLARMFCSRISLDKLNFLYEKCLSMTTLYLHKKNDLQYLVN